MLAGSPSCQRILGNDPHRRQSSAVASALAQTYPKIEALVSDNASTDGSLETLKSYNDPRLRVLGWAWDRSPITNEVR